MRKVPNVNTHIFKQPDIPWALISPEARLMLEAYGDLGAPLAGIERSGMITFVNSEADSPNHERKNNETVISLEGVNALIDYIGGIIATAINAPTFDVNGVSLDGATQSINLNYIPSTNGSILDNHFALAFVKSAPGVARDEVIFSSENVARTNRSQIGMQTPAVGFTALNSGAIEGVTGFTKFESNKLYGLSRENNVDFDFLLNGAITDTKIESSTALPDVAYQLGFIKQISSFFFDGTLSSFVNGQAIGFNHPIYNTNLRTLLTTLGTLP